ncbi:MAG: hypothetical protein ACJ75T_09645 [Solirubrobacterales bacterium]
MDLSLTARRSGLVFCFALVALLVALMAGGRARAAETLYWDNYGDDPDTIGFANIDGNGGGQLNTGSEAVESPEGMAYDTVTNRFFVTTGTGAGRHILAINADGSGATTFAPPGAPVAEPEGVAINPATRTIYWANTKTGATSIAWANLDGSGGGTLNTSGASVENPCCRIAVDPVGGRVYWVNSPSGSNTISFANSNNTGGGGQLNLTGSTVEPGGEGVVVDSAAGRVYFLGAIGVEEGIGYASVNGSGAGNVALAGATMKTAWGLAFDPAFNRLYWGNEGNAEVRTNAIGFVNLSGSGGGVSIATAPVANPQDPVILKSPLAAGAPGVTRNPTHPAELTCSTGSWGADSPGGFVYQAPRTFAYLWTINGTVLGSGPERITASKSGSYACTVTATNQIGSATQTSAPISVKATKVKLSTKKKGSGKPGKPVTFQVKAVNQGDIDARSSTRICVKLPKASKADLKTPKCKKLGPLNGHAKKTVKIRVKVKPGADEGTAKLSFLVKGAAGKTAKSKIVVR